MNQPRAPVLTAHCHGAASGVRATGALTVIVGCMFSGKTTRLLRRMTQYPVEQVCAIKHSRDVRYGLHSIVSHDGATHPCRMVCAAEEINAFVAPLTRCVAIDEGHFFANSLIDVVAKLRSDGMDCIVTALDRSSWGTPFPQIVELLRSSDQPVLCRARCGRCGQPANRTQRLTPIVNGNLVGGTGDYEPRCARCWRLPVESAFERA